MVTDLEPAGTGETVIEGRPLPLSAELDTGTAEDGGTALFCQFLFGFC